MCGRFTLGVDGEVLQEVLELGNVPAELEPRYNIAPTQDVAVVTDPESRDVSLFRWGLVPSWAKDLSIGNRLINARAETVAEKPSFRAAFRKRRCLVLADGFYEWRAEGGTKQPYYISMKDGDPFAMAGLWEQWDDGVSDVPLATCTIITTEPNEMMSALHRRMPVILPRSRHEAWLDPALHDTQLLRAALVPYDSDAMTFRPVDRAVNNPRNDGPELLEMRRDDDKEE